MNPIYGRRMGPPLPGAKESMEWLEDRGFCIIIHSLRARTEHGAKVIRDWMEYYGIPHHGVSIMKPDAVVYIDDRAIKHVDWESTMKELHSQFGGLD